MARLKIPDRPDRAPDIILPENSKECEVSLWIEENVYAIETIMSEQVINSVVGDNPCESVKYYMEATLKYYNGHDVRCDAIVNYYAEQILLGDT